MDSNNRGVFLSTMEKEASVHLMKETEQASVHMWEEEKNGWTIVSSLEDDQKSDMMEENAEEIAKEADESVDLVANQQNVIDGSFDLENSQEAEQEGKCEGHGDKISKSVEEDPDHDDGDGELRVDYAADRNHKLTSRKEILCTDNAKKDFVWGSFREGAPLLGDECVLAHQQVHKHGGLLWRVTLLATLGFAGWFVITGLNGSIGKNFRNIKDGEAVLDTI